MDEKNEEIPITEFPSNLPPEAMGAKVYVDGVHIGFLINPVYEKLIELREKINSGEVNEDGVQRD